MEKIKILKDKEKMIGTRTIIKGKISEKTETVTNNGITGTKKVIFKTLFKIRMHGAWMQDGIKHILLIREKEKTKRKKTKRRPVGKQIRNEEK